MKDTNLSADVKFALSKFNVNDIVKWTSRGPDRMAVGIITEIDDYEVAVDWFIMHGSVCENKLLTYCYEHYGDFSVNTFWLFKCEIITECDKLALLLKLS